VSNSSIRGVGSQVLGRGIAITDPITHIPQNAPDLRALTTAHVRSLKFGQESFPGLIEKSGDKETTVYDLTSPPPVRRTFLNESFQMFENNTWRHSLVIQTYTDLELDAILAFLREAAKPASEPPEHPAAAAAR